MIEKLNDHSKVVVGTKQALRAIKEDQAQVLFIAKNAEKHVVRNIEAEAKERNIQIIHAESMEKLGMACGISVKAATAVLLK